MTIPSSRRRYGRIPSRRSSASRDRSRTDLWIYRIVVGSLALSILAVIVATTVIVLDAGRCEIPDVLVAIGTGAIGALAGLLAPVPSGR